MKSSPERARPARVIKAAQLRREVPHGAASPAPLTPPQAHAEPASDHLLRVAREVARATILAAQHDAKSIRDTVGREARRQALAEGRAAGYAEGINQAKLDSERILQDAAREAQEILLRAESQVGQLACEIAAHLLGVEIRLNPEIVERAVLTILQETTPSGPVSIEVSAADYQRVLEAAPTFRAALGSAAELRVTEDRSLPQGGIRVSGPHGSVERNWQEGLLAISEAFEEVARRGV
ncbi:MAG: FliH/SctL family protein [Thermaerobacter sp.]|nr:FliH/SctL family protein [Thermaerobacter sp.]